MSSDTTDSGAGDRPTVPTLPGVAASAERGPADAGEGASLPSEVGLRDPEAGAMQRVVARGAAWLDSHRRWAAVDVGGRMLDRYRSMAGSLLAGALAYRLFLVSLPLALMAVGLLGMGEKTAAAAPEEVAKRLGIGGLMARTMRTTAQDATSLRWLTLAGGFVLLLWSTNALLRALRTVHALAWRLPIERLRGLPMATLIASVLMLVSSALSGGVNGATADWPFVALPANAAVFCVHVGVWLWLTGYLPSRVGRRLELLPGALSFAVGVNVIRVFTVYYVAPFLNERAATYGALGYASMALLVLYAFGELAILSALLSASIVERRRERASARVA